MYDWYILISLVEKNDFSSCPFWLKVHHMNGHYSYWFINLINDEPFDYLSIGTFGQVEQTKI